MKINFLALHLQKVASLEQDQGYEVAQPKLFSLTKSVASSKWK